MTKSYWTLGVIDNSYRIRWINKMPFMPQRSNNTSIDEADKAVLD